MVGLDDLRKALLSERETGKLLQIAPDFFLRAHATLRGLREKVQGSEDPFSDEVQKMILETRSIEQTLLDLFAIRAGKILSLAEWQAQGQYIDREEVKRMIPPEREMFDRVSGAVRHCQEECALSPAAAPLPIAGETESPGRSLPGPEALAAETAMPGADAPAANPSGTAPAYTLVRVLSDMDPFMGVDGMTYALEKGDILMLPERNAEVLVERNIALNMNVGK